MDDKRRKIINAVWNAAGIASLAAITIVLPMIISRIWGIKLVGEFAIALTTSQVLYAIALFGINIYQRTDLNIQYSFHEYNRARIYTTSLMTVVCIIIVALVDFSTQVKVFTLLLLPFYITNSMAESYQSFYFQKSRLDLCGKSQLYRFAIGMIAFYASAKIMNSVYLSIVILDIANFIVFIFSTHRPIKKFNIAADDLKPNSCAKKIICECTVICSILLLNMFILNVAKYAIEYYLNDEIQGYYSIIYLPVMGAIMLSEFVFHPQFKLYTVTLNNDIKKFIKLMLINMMVILSITMAIDIIMELIGIHILAHLYKVNLSQYVIPMRILIGGSAFVALAMLPYFILILERKQKFVLLCYIAIAGVSVIISFCLVKNMGMLGACISFLFTFILLFIVLTSGIIYIVAKRLGRK